MHFCSSLLRLGYPGVELTGMHDNIAKVVQILPFASEVGTVQVPAFFRKHLMDVPGLVWLWVIGVSALFLVWLVAHSWCAWSCTFI